MPLEAGTYMIQSLCCWMPAQMLNGDVFTFSVTYHFCDLLEKEFLHFVLALTWNVPRTYGQNIRRAN
jgi:hypothetical protein